MDVNNTGQTPAADEQELAQVLAGMNQHASSGMQFEETGATTQVPVDPATTPQNTTTPTVTADPNQPTSGEAPTDEGTLGTTETAVESPAAPEPPVMPVASAPVVPEPVIQAAPEPEPTTPSVESSAMPIPAPIPSSISPEFESLKKDALEQLRPLVDKLNVSAQEKFDTLLLIIRSTDDHSLIGAANEAAKQIENESKRAEALLDVIKEIDFFSRPQT